MAFRRYMMSPPRTQYTHATACLACPPAASAGLSSLYTVLNNLPPYGSLAASAAGNNGAVGPGGGSVLASLPSNVQQQLAGACMPCARPGTASHWNGRGANSGRGARRLLCSWLSEWLPEHHIGSPVSQPLRLWLAVRAPAPAPGIHHTASLQ